MRVLFVTAEAHPLAKTGGLGDASRGLAIALKRQGIDVRILMPAYPRAFTQIGRPQAVTKLRPQLGISDAQLVAGRLPDSDVPVWLVDSPTLYEREGGPYQDRHGCDWPDNARRFAFFAYTAAAIAMGRAGLSWRPDVVHANDWHAGLVPLLLSDEWSPRPATVFTVHNMAFQGNFDLDLAEPMGLCLARISIGDIELYGKLSFLKAGIRFADKVTTVSPTYAKEVMTPELGCGMDDVLREKGADFSGILNGIEDSAWNPATDPFLACAYDANDRSGKSACKLALQRDFGLKEDRDKVVVGYVSRLTHQKMADTLLEALPWIAERGLHLVVNGQGDPDLERRWAEAGKRYAGTLAVKIGYDERVAHRLHAGSDVLLAPARFEPCGLTQLYALRYGALPLVRRTGGLADTIGDCDAEGIENGTATGFVFDEPTPAAIISALDTALAMHRTPLLWRRVQRRAMTQNWSWDASAAKYVDLYDEIAHGSSSVAEEDAWDWRYASDRPVESVSSAP